VTALYIAAGAVFLLAAWAVFSYNALVKARNKVGESWSGIDVQLERRHDLVPNLVETVKGYAAHEHDTFVETARARAEAVAANGIPETERTEARLGAALGSVQALAESYPELKAARSFQALQAQLAQIEDEIQAARRIYNANVQEYNTRIQVFPNSLIARRLSFRTRGFLELEPPAARSVPQTVF
jgi:LemA protein